MSAASDRQELYRRASEASAPGMVLGGAALAILGAIAFVAFAAGDDPGRAWRIFHVNFLFFTGLAQGAVVFVAAYRITKGWWAGPIVRFAEAASAFLPVALILFVATIPAFIAQSQFAELNFRVLSWRALRELAGDGVSLAAHTRNHPVLTRLSREAALRLLNVPASEAVMVGDSLAHDIEAPSPDAAVLAGRRAVLLEHPLPPARKKRLSLFARAVRAADRDDGGWVLYRIRREGPAPGR